MIASRPVLAVVLAGLSGAETGRASDGEIPFYMGRAACLECHAAENPCALKTIPEHARAYETLSRRQARHIAALCGVAEPPQQSRICLGCHATAADVGPRWTTPEFDIAQGVQCEACHGAGSLHAAARWGAGSSPVRHAMAVPQRSRCATCHRPRRSHEAVVESGFRVAAIDREYRNPVNLAVSASGDVLYVVCEHSDSLLVVDTAAGRVLREIAVGRRPHDVAVTADDRTVYVTNRFSGTVSVFDASSGRVVDEIGVGAEPHGVVAGSAGRFVYVANTAQDSISVIDARTRTEISRLAAGRGPWSIAMQPLAAELAVTNVRPHAAAFREPPYSEVTVVGRLDVGGRVVDRPDAAGAVMLQGIATVPGRGVTLFTLMRNKNLVPITRLEQGWTVTNGLGILWPDGRIDQVLLDEPGAAFPDPMDVAVSPDGRRALVTSGGADLVAVVDVEALLALVTATSDRDRREVLPNYLGTSSRFVVGRIAVGTNPRGVVYSPDGRFAYVANTLDDSVTVLDADDYTVAATIDLGGPRAVSETRHGEKIFHSAAITAGRQFSCRSCHPDGHVNALTFDIEADGIGMHPVDNRSLRGILDTAPFKWEGTNPTLSFQCGPRLAVFFTRLAPLEPPDLAALVRYISTIERPPNPNRHADGLTLAQRRGKMVFERSTNNRGELIPPGQRCTTCHNSPYLTGAGRANVGTTMWFDQPVEARVVDLADLNADIEDYGELGLYYFLDTGTPTRVFDTPHLTNIFDSAPYLHNGAAPTLEEIWTRFDVVSLHGATADLSRRQLNDLIAYLKSL